jgi:hypothetical protein
MKIFASALFCLAFYSAAQAQDLPPGKGGEILNANCGGCHGLNRTTSAGKNKADWKDTVDRMMGKGADVKPEEVDVLLTYLAKYYGEDVNVNTASAKDLQDQLDITPAEADAIVKARAAAPFKAFADLGKVTGLDAKKLEPLKSRIVFN